MQKYLRSVVISKTLMVAAAAVMALSLTSGAEAKPCKTQVSSLEDAKSSCEAILGCSKKDPPQVISCNGRTNRWICKCVKSKGTAGFGLEAYLFEHEAYLIERVVK